MIQLAIVDGSRRLKNGSLRSFRHPATMSAGVFVRQLDHPGNVARIVLQIAIGGHDVAAARVREAGGKCGRLAEVATEADHAQARIAGLDRGEELERLVSAPVVNRKDSYWRPKASRTAVSSWWRSATLGASLRSGMTTETSGHQYV